MKVAGAEFKAFYNDPLYWPEKSDVYYDDVVFVVNGDPLSDEKDPGQVADTDIVEFSGGVVMNSPHYKSGREPSLDQYFRRWQKEQTTVRLVVECSRGGVDAIKAAVVAAGGKVLK
jgi:hypothetical protein